MKLADIANGPDWIVWAVFLILAILSAENSAFGGKIWKKIWNI